MTGPRRLVRDKRHTIRHDKKQPNPMQYQPAADHVYMQSQYISQAYDIEGLRS